MNPYVEIKRLISDATPIIEKYSREAQTPLPELDRLLDSQATHIMVYGAYNAGKSTLIDAFLGEIKAPIGDIPTTDKVSRFTWKGFEVLDTPGINAPIEHEEITEEQTKRCGLMLFVIREGDLDAKDVYQRLFEMLQRGKKVFIVLNHQLSTVEEKARVLARIERNLLEFAKKSECPISDDDLKRIDICLVNAKTALKARLEGKSLLLESSGFNELELKLLSWIKSNDNENRRLELAKNQISEILLNPVLKNMENALLDRHADVEQLKAVRDSKAHFELQISNLKSAASRKVVHLVNAKKRDVEEVLTNADISDSERERQLQTMFEPLGDELNAWFQEELNIILSELQAHLGQGTNSANLQNQFMIQLNQSFEGCEDSGVMGKMADTFGDAIKKGISDVDNIKKGFLFLRKIKIPFFKGRWESTLGTWAKRAGPVIQVITGIWDAYKSAKTEDDQNRRKREHQISVARAVEDVCELVSDAMLNNIATVINEIEGLCVGALSVQMDRLEREAGVFNEDRQQIDKLKDTLAGVGF